MTTPYTASAAYAMSAVLCRCMATVALLAITCVLTACASQNTVRASSPTGGVDLTLSVHDETGAEEYYEIDRKGNLGWGGGMAARLTKTTWTDPLTEDELRQLKELLQAADWFREKPESTNQPPEFRYRMRINSPESHRTFTLYGDHPKLAPIRELLSTAARRRLKPELDKLPEPSSQR